MSEYLNFHILKTYALYKFSYYIENFTRNTRINSRIFKDSIPEKQSGRPRSFSLLNN